MVLQRNVSEVDDGFPGSVVSVAQEEWNGMPLFIESAIVERLISDGTRCATHPHLFCSIDLHNNTVLNDDVYAPKFEAA